jgi:hypothetical protein
LSSAYYNGLNYKVPIFTCNGNNCFGLRFFISDQGILMDHKPNQYQSVLVLVGTFGGLFSFVKLVIATLVLVGIYLYFYVFCCFQKKKKNEKSLNEKLMEDEEKKIPDDGKIGVVE